MLSLLPLPVASHWVTINYHRHWSTNDQLCTVNNPLILLRLLLCRKRLSVKITTNEPSYYFLSLHLYKPNSCFNLLLSTSSNHITHFSLDSPLLSFSLSASLTFSPSRFLPPLCVYILCFCSLALSLLSQSGTGPCEIKSLFSDKLKCVWVERTGSLFTVASDQTSVTSHLS